MLYLKTVTLNNKQNRKLLQSDLWSSSRPISELDYSIMTVSFSWTIKEYPVPVSSGLFRRVCFLMFADLLFNFQSFLLSMNFIKRFWLNRYYNVSSSFNTVFVEHWLSRATVLWKSAMILSLFKNFFVHSSGLTKV